MALGEIAPRLAGKYSSNNVQVPVTVNTGGTGLTSFSAYGIICAGTTSTGNFQQVSGTGNSGQILTSQGASSLPVWTTATYPATTTINQILYSNASNTVSGISSSNNATLMTNSSGVPSFSQPFKQFAYNIAGF